MDETRVIVTPDEITGKAREMKIMTELSNNLKSSLVMPHEASAYSIAVEYMSEWFLAGFQDNYFRSVYINEKHIIDDFRSMTREEMIKRHKPCCTIIPRTEQDFNRDNLDLYNYGTNLYANRARFQDSFFGDIEKRLFLAMDMKMNKIIFTFRAKVQTLSTAQNMAEHNKLRFRANGTQGKYVDVDYLVPEQLMLAIAIDAGFSVENGLVKNETEFLCYINSHSSVPIMRKFTTSLGRFQYFMKVQNMYFHIKTNNVSLDEGERKGHIMTNYNVEFEAELLYPAPKFFAYYTMEKREFLQEQTGANSYTEYAFPIANIPTTNEKGWDQLLTTNYEDDMENFNAKKPVVIAFDDLIGDLRKVLDYTKSIYLSPAIFIDFKLFNEAKEVDITVDWLKMTITTSKFLSNINSYLVMYVDKKYLNEQVLKIRKVENERITPYIKSKNPRGDV